MTDTAVVRTDSGQFLPGSRANPNGRPKGAKNKITELKQAMEIAIREGMDPKEIAEVFKAMVEQGKLGNTKAAKLVLDKALSSNQDGAIDEEKVAPQYVFVIENATISPNSNAAKPIEVIDATVIDAEIGTPQIADSHPTAVPSTNTLNISQLELFPL